MENYVNISEINSEYLDLCGINLDRNCLKLISKEIMYRYCFVPVKANKNSVIIALSNTSDKEALEAIKLLLKKEIKVISADKDQIYSLINTIDEMQSTDVILERLKKEYEAVPIIKQDISKRDSFLSVESSPIVKLSNSIIIQAINMKASDIHIEPFQDEVIVRYRIDGALHEYKKLPKESYTSLCSRIKIQSGMDIAEKRVPQDGKIQFKYNDIVYDLRISTLPTIYNEKIVIRILYKQEKCQDLKSLGFYNLGRNDVSSILQNNHGLILVTGPTGSGKTTTLYSMLEEIDKSHNNIVTIEDPVEINIKGVNQVNVNTKAGLTFANGLRSILRQDPNIIMVGEIRDEETTQIAVRAAITGHLVISTLHTNDSASSIIRLVDMGVPKYLVADSLLACIAQRLIRTICNFCKTEYNPSTNEAKTLGINDFHKLYKGSGCVICNNTGYKGRTVVYEIMNIDDNMRRIISEGKSIDELRVYNDKKGMRSIKDNCRELVKKGITTYDEFIKLCSNN